MRKNLPAILAVILWWSSAAVAAELPVRAKSLLSKGIPHELIVLYDDRDIEFEMERHRRVRRLEHDDGELLSLRRQRYRELKSRAAALVTPGEAEIVREYDHLPMSFIRFRDVRALERLAASPGVDTVYENRPLYRQLTQSLPLINQPQAAAIGLRGTGVTVAVLDTGVNYTLSNFGSCTAPGVPSTCRVVAAQDLASNDNALDDIGHGSNVSSIVAGVAPGAGLAALDIFDPDGTSSEALLISGINWAIANKSIYNIVAINMSLGDGLNYTSPCGNKGTNPFVTPVKNARTAGIIPVAASGNEGYTNGLSSPACTPGVVSAGAVYDANAGGRQWSSGCTDSTTAVDKVTCFSNSATFLTMFAPGALITAAGSIMGGTSQASPHVAGAVAVMRAAFPTDTLDQTVARLTGNGVPVTDPRNGITKPRLNLLAAAGPPVNNSFAAATVLYGDAGTAHGDNANATKEAGEPFHAGATGGASVWWKWTPSISGMASLDTRGSGFDTLLAVYTGATVGALTSVAGNDNDASPGGTSGVSFIIQAGTDYRIAVDGLNGSSGPITLHWNLVPQADLSALIACSSTVASGGEITCDVSITNNGPSAATGTTAKVALPSGVSIVSASPECSGAGGLVTCSYGSISSGGPATSHLTFTSTATGQLSITIEASSAVSDPSPGDNTAAAVIEVVSPLLMVPSLSLWGIMASCITLLSSGRWLRKNVA